MRYVVYSLDIWGHVAADCIQWGCPCVLGDDPSALQHDDNACDCTEDCNEQFRVGEIEVSEDATDDAILNALADDGFLTELGRKVAEIDDYSDGPLDVNDNDGRRLFHLIPEDAS